MIAVTTHDDGTASVSYFGQLVGHYAPVRLHRTRARAWRVVTVTGAMGYASSARRAARMLVDLMRC